MPKPSRAPSTHLLQEAGYAGSLQQPLDHLRFDAIAGVGYADQLFFTAAVHPIGDSPLIQKPMSRWNAVTSLSPE